jgi:hypothetical protein
MYYEACILEDFLSTGWCTCNRRIIAEPESEVVYLPSITVEGRGYGR